MAALTAIHAIDCGKDIPRNFGALSADSPADIIGQLKYPSGHAVSPTRLEKAFGAGDRHQMAVRGRISLDPTGIIRTIRQTQEALATGQRDLDLADIHVVLCSQMPMRSARKLSRASWCRQTPTYTTRGPTSLCPEPRIP